MSDRYTEKFKGLFQPNQKPFGVAELKYEWQNSPLLDLSQRELSRICTAMGMGGWVDESLMQAKTSIGQQVSKVTSNISKVVSDVSKAVSDASKAVSDASKVVSGASKVVSDAS